MTQLSKGLSLLILLILSGMSNTVLGGHVIPGEITYRNIDTLTYEVSFVYYRYCQGVAFSTPLNSKVVCQTSGASRTLTLTRRSITEMKYTCASVAAQCNPPNTSRTGEGLERHIYVDTVDFRKGVYRTLVSGGCTDIRFEATECCRNSNINTGAANKNAYNYAYLNLKESENSSPTFSNNPLFQVCCNQPVFYASGGMDVRDYDSLSFAFAQPLSSANTVVSYSGSFSYNNPVTAYYPSTLKFPYFNANSNPPIGVYLDGETGEFIYTPTRCDEFTVVVFEVKEWRMDSSGKMQHIGTVRRDMNLQTEQCQGNNSPIVKGPYSYTVCEEEELCFTIKTEDKVKTPPPPLPKPDPDTTRISWDEGIQWATFKVSSDTDLNQSARFCWTPKVGRASSNPYSFTARVEDGSCPRMGISYRSFAVLVKPKPITEVELDTLDCEIYTVTSTPTRSIMSPRYLWTITDSSGGPGVDPRKQPYFKSSGTSISTESHDTIVFQQKRQYFIHHTLRSPTCSSEYIDTLNVGNVIEVDLASTLDTFHCAGNELILRPGISNTASKVNFLWNDGSSADTLLVKLADTVSVDTFSLRVEEASGCYGQSKVYVFNRPNPTIDKVADAATCMGDSVVFSTQGHLALWDNPHDADTTKHQQGSSLSYSWLFRGAEVGSDTFIYAKNEGPYTVEVTDSLNCNAKTAVELDFLTIHMPNDLEICVNGGAMSLRAMEDSRNAGGTWSCPARPSMVRSGYIFDPDSLGSPLTGSVRFQVYYRYMHPVAGCEIVDSMEVKINPLPRVEVRDVSFCQDKDTVSVNKDDIILRPGNTNLGRQAWRCVDCGTYNESDIIEDLGTGNQGALQDFVFHIDDKAMPLGTRSGDSISLELQFTNAFGCYNKDTLMLGVAKVPKINLKAFPDLCWDEGIVDLKVLSNVTPYDGIWKAIDSTGFASGANLNSALKGDTTGGDTLNTIATAQPGEGSSFTYMMRYFHNRSGCPTWRDTTLTIRGLPIPLIDHTSLEINSLSEPYQICELNSNIGLTANYSGGVWSSDDALAISGSDFTPGNVTNYNSPFYIQYVYSDIYGCQGSDSVQVEIHGQQTLTISNDTSLTWYATNMSLDVEGSYTNSTSMTWLPLTGGSVVDNRDPSTVFSFSAGPDTITRHLLYAFTDEGGGTVCPFAERTMTVFIHPTPCIEINVGIDLATKDLMLSPSNLLMDSYRWEAGDTMSTAVSPVLNVASHKDSLVLIKLTAFNELGDSCVIVKSVNIKTGSIKNLSKKLKIYPNPVKDGFVIDFDGYIQGEQIQVFNSSGATVIDTKLKGNWIDCNHLAPGVYTLVMRHERQTYLGRFVKE